MSRSKPYDRARGDRNVEGQWKHDLHDTRGPLSSRLGTSSSKGGARSGSGSGSGSSSLLDRISGGQGKKLLPDSAPRKRMYGYDGGAGGSGAATSRNAGVELLPATAGSSSAQGRTARSGRASRPRGSGGDDAGQRALVANGLAALSKRHTSGSGITSTRGESLSIVGAARTSIWVRVERLARGTTAEDVKSAFAHAPIGEARLITSGRTVTVDVELPDRDSADRLVQQYDGVSADGEKLRVFVRSRDGASGASGASGANGNQNSGQRNSRAAAAGAGALSSRMDRKPNSPPSSGKMYSDTIDGPPAVTAPPREPRQSSLASRLGRR